MVENTIECDIEDIRAEYETQYFGFGREVLKESLKDLVDFEIQSQITKVKTFLTSSQDSDHLSDDKKKRLSCKCDELMKFCMENSEKPLKGLYSEVDKFFSIPDYVLRPEDEDYNDIVNKDEIKCLLADNEDLRRRVERADAANDIMTKELQKLEEIHPLQEAQRAMDILRFAREALVIPPYTQLQALSKRLT